MNQQAIDQIKAERDQWERIARINKEQVATLKSAWSDSCRLYEELRTATDGGSESMTHADAVEHVKALAAENKVLRDALESIALAGMSGCGQESEEGMRDWHARRAWEFIGIAARALTKGKS